MRDDSSPDRHDDVAGRRRTLGTQGVSIVAVALAAALVIAVVAGVLLSVEYTQREDSVAPTVAGPSSADRREVQEAVGLFAANLNTYSVKDISDYRSRIRPLLTDGFGKSFELAVDNTIAMVKATNMSSEGEVLSTAVAALDDRTATTLVVADAEVTSDLGDRQRHFRWKVTLVKQGDAWLIDNFTPVA